MLIQNSTFFQECLDVEGRPIVETIEPTEEEIKEAIKQGKAKFNMKTKTITVKDALMRILRADLRYVNANGSTIPDPHEKQKMEMYELLFKLKSVENNDLETEIIDKESILLKERSEKFYVTEMHGYLCYFLDGKKPK